MDPYIHICTCNPFKLDMHFLSADVYQTKPKLSFMLSNSPLVLSEYLKSSTLNFSFELYLTTDVLESRTFLERLAFPPC